MDSVDHTFVIVNRKPGSDINNPETWGDAWVVEPWFKDGLIYPAVEFKKTMYNILEWYKAQGDQLYREWRFPASSIKDPRKVDLSLTVREEIPLDSHVEEYMDDLYYAENHDLEHYPYLHTELTQAPRFKEPVDRRRERILSFNKQKSRARHYGRFKQVLDELRTRQRGDMEGKGGEEMPLSSTPRRSPN